jgi:hypothetical protein
LNDRRETGLYRLSADEYMLSQATEITKRAHEHAKVCPSFKLALEDIDKEGVRPPSQGLDPNAADNANRYTQPSKLGSECYND